MEGDTIKYPTVDEPTQGTLTVTKRGAPKLIDPYHYEYIKSKTVNEVDYWHCPRKNSKVFAYCPATATSMHGETLIFSTKPHNHSSDPVAVKVNIAMSELMTKVRNDPKIPTSSIIAEWSKVTTNPAMKSKSILKRTLQRKVTKTKSKVRKFPPTPKNFDELAELPADFTECFDKERFLIYNDMLEGHGRIMVFASAFGLSTLCNSKTWGGDGTFGVVPSPFYQLYTILAEMDGVSYPSLFCFLPDKKGATYKEVFEIIKREVSQKGELKLEQFFVDFESAAINQIKPVFGRTVKVTGCQVHWFRNLHKKQGEVGNLLSWSMTRPPCKEFLTAIHGLCYVPPDEVQPYYQALLDKEMNVILEDLDENGGMDIEEVDDCKESLQNYLDYVEKTYIGHKSRVGWSLARYPPTLWNQVENALSGGQLSTNRNEGFHSRLRASIKYNSTIWALLSELIDVEAETRAKREEDRANIDYRHEDAAIEGEDDDAVPGGSREHPGSGHKYQRKQKMRWLRNIILKREEYAPVDYLKRVAHLDPF
jgi:hypothetical protein